jgi:hypothetical protein
MLRGQVQILLWVFQEAYRPDGLRGPEGLQGLYRSNGYLTKQEFAELVSWKMFGRDNLPKPSIQSNADVKLGTAKIAEAITAGEPASNLVRLADAVIPGVKVSLASTILATWSDDYPIIDPRAWRALSRMTGNSYFASFHRDGYERYGDYVEIVRGVAARVGATPRNIDKALYVIGRKRP